MYVLTIEGPNGTEVYGPNTIDGLRAIAEKHANAELTELPEDWTQGAVVAWHVVGTDTAYSVRALKIEAAAYVIYDEARNLWYDHYINGDDEADEFHRNFFEATLYPSEEAAQERIDDLLVDNLTVVPVAPCSKP